MSFAGERGLQVLVRLGSFEFAVMMMHERTSAPRLIELILILNKDKYPP